MKTGTILQRLFSCFANGWPGKGLLILRIAAAAFLIRASLSTLSQAASFPEALLPFAAGIIACLLGVGLWTPLASAAATLYEIRLAYDRPQDLWLAGMSIAITVALALLGPGAWSIDAMAYGRRRLSTRK